MMISFSAIRSLLLATASLILSVTPCTADDTQTTTTQTPMQMAPFFPAQANGTPATDNSIAQNIFQSLSCQAVPLTSNLSGALVSLNTSVATLTSKSAEGSVIANLNQFSSNLQSVSGQNLQALNTQLNTLMMSGKLNSIEHTNVNALSTQITLLQSTLSDSTSGINNLVAITGNLSTLNGVNNALGNVGSLTSSVVSSGVNSLTGQVNDMGGRLSSLATNSITVLRDGLMSPAQMLQLSAAMSNVDSNMRSLTSNIGALTNSSTMMYHQIDGLTNFTNSNPNGLISNITNLASQLQTNLATGSVYSNFTLLTSLNQQLSAINGQLNTLTSLNGALNIFTDTQTGLTIQLSNIAGLVNGGALGITNPSATALPNVASQWLNSGSATNMYSGTLLSLSATSSTILADNQGVVAALTYNSDNNSYGDPSPYINQATGVLSSYNSSLSPVNASLKTFLWNVVSAQSSNGQTFILYQPSSQQNVVCSQTPNGQTTIITP